MRAQSPLYLLLAVALSAQAQAAVLVDFSADKLEGVPLTTWQSGGMTLSAAAQLRMTTIDGRRALAFDGTQSLAGASPALDILNRSKGFTIEAWAYATEVGGHGTLVGVCGAGGGTGTECNWSTAANGGAFRSGLKVTQTFNAIPAPKAWHHFAWTWERGKRQLGELSIYVDGELDSRQPATVAFPPNPALSFGNANGLAPARVASGFAGAIAAVRIADVPETQEEIRADAGIVAAYAPDPANGSATASLALPLAWKPGSAAVAGAVVHLGTDRAAVERGDPASAITASATACGPQRLVPGVEYFWRVEQHDAGGAVVGTGALWRFTADPGLAASPQPRDGDSNVPASQRSLSWTPGRYATGQRVVIGTDRAAVEGSFSVGIDAPLDHGSLELAEPLKPGTRYFWRIDLLRPEGPAHGQVWTFRTQDEPVKNDVTFFASSDSHYGRENNASINRRVIQEMNALPGTELPAAAGYPRVRTPRGVVLNGDLLDMGFDQDTAAANLSAFVGDYGLTGHDGLLCYPLYEGFGNHDGGPDKSFVRKAIRERNARRIGLTAISPNGLHYSWDWDHVHCVNLNLFGGAGPADVKGVNGPEHDPEGSLDFLVSDLAKEVGSSRRPVVIFQHFGWTGGMADWWQEQAKDRFYDAIKDYRIACLINGHSHGASFSPWKGLLTVHDGATARPDGNTGDFLVVRITDTEVSIIQRKLGGWGMNGRFKIGAASP
jgi:cytolysin (calcineurin-like family phosphatase)